MTLALRSAVVAATVSTLASAVAFEALVAQEVGARRGGTGITSPEVAADRRVTFIGSARRECLDHAVVFSATGLQRLMKLYCDYYDQSRTHLSLNKDAPVDRRIVAPGHGRVVAIPQVGELHHRYERQAA